MLIGSAIGKSKTMAPQDDPEAKLTNADTMKHIPGIKEPESDSPTTFKFVCQNGTRLRVALTADGRQKSTGRGKRPDLQSLRHVSHTACQHQSQQAYGHSLDPSNKCIHTTLECQNTLHN
mmetsp:Transcript_10637/g.16674  ORF Transcript_10637/g.16674 Transcript_10637/m.16674 type:complete len:120 (-) Transcript_10637:528-887(-)